jgi:hypothetical protein
MKNPSRRAIERFMNDYGVPLLMAKRGTDVYLWLLVDFEVARDRLFREARRA